MNKYRLDYSCLSPSEAEGLIKRIETRTMDGGAFNYADHVCTFVVEDDSLSFLEIPASCTLTFVS